MAVSLEQFIEAAAAVLETTPEELQPTIKLSLAASALAAPFASFGGQDFYPDPIQRAAVLASRIIRNHPLQDGNKRVALVLMDVYLQGEGFDFHSDPEDIDSVFRALAARMVTEDDFCDWLRDRADRIE